VLVSTNCVVANCVVLVPVGAVGAVTLPLNVPVVADTAANVDVPLTAKVTPLNAPDEVTDLNLASNKVPDVISEIVATELAFVLLTDKVVIVGRYKNVLGVSEFSNNGPFVIAIPCVPA